MKIKLGIIVAFLSFVGTSSVSWATETPRLSVVVKNQGVPVEHAVVTVISWADSNYIANKRTSSDGLVTFDGLPEGQFDISVQSEGSSLKAKRTGNTASQESLNVVVAFD
ncbi:carboxypeptidase regulatory-like domain-containing protein [Vibrio vulnificus]|uniref:Carboxypeptidase regulatory-like domain-containing protein n=1 Tax=Vibrio vulnificus TaxID=672 RepID=A0A8H9TGW3_VIBVL|nr:carboxypeptidase regulatory-like domain-containing protein [Vibrio vulnificus]EJV9423786.1 carboxypeptidase regulatory-like domain-containing protein [Vibrio vulnificus]ELI0350208.1 carboxypeptidase regulatory-like domain-containing protein [Vibrio vulnificus]ELI0611822.1 carboxypeptidase regulatory-like domain-containing protein [Vibrio vulnificus]MCU8224511.1 carboxypeptidase-like regulatory domain-containing protein [Vibrio vulnificus]MCU8272300.1 carboxypeptidase-like regulatory domain-